MREELETMTKNNTNKIRSYVWLGLTVVWMVFIYYKSSQPYQEQDMRPLLAEWIPQSFVDNWLPHLEFTYDGGLVTWTKPYDFIEFMIRKCAHIAEYMLLTLLWNLTLAAASLRRGFSIALAAVLSFLYAASDEWHQTFVPGRTGHAIDVGVDSIGIVLVTILFAIAAVIKYRRRKRLS